MPQGNERMIEVFEKEHVNEILLVPESEDTPAVFLSPPALNIYLNMMDGMLATDTSYKARVADSEPIMKRLAEIQTLAEMDSSTPELLGKVYDHFALVVGENGEEFGVQFEDGQFLKSEDLIPLEGAPPPDELTLKKIHQGLKAKMSAGMSISPIASDEDPETLQYWFEYCWERMSLYASYETLTKRDFAGDEIGWGSLCYKLWLDEDYDNCQVVIDWAVPADILMYQLVLCQATGSQKDVNVVTKVSEALCAVARKIEPGGRFLAEIEGIESHLTFNLRVALDDEATANNQNHIIVSTKCDFSLLKLTQPRIKLVQLTAIDRTIFPNTEIQKTLVECWDRYDEGIYKVDCLRAVFKAMRAVLAPTHVQYLTQVSAVSCVVCIVPLL